jgi:GNAT superfamily N-acetyltransferase
MQLQLAKNEQQVAACFAVMAQLRPHLSQAEFSRRVLLQQQEGYQLLMALDSNKTVRGGAGFVLAHKLAWGKHLYVDDLVTDQQAQSQGIGKLMLDWLQTYAMQQGCEQLHLDSGVQRFGAHKFYLREGMRISSHHFQLDLPV